jgi:hypothetical protein
MRSLASLPEPEHARQQLGISPGVKWEPPLEAVDHPLQTLSAKPERTGSGRLFLFFQSGFGG